MGGHGYVKHDPAIERWNLMREDVYKHFKFTPRAAVISIVGLLVFPASIYWVAANTDSRWKWGGTRKGQPFAVRPLEPTPEAE